MTGSPQKRQSAAMPVGSTGLDEMDMAIVSELKNDGRRSAIDMSKALGIHRNTVSVRLKRLLDERIVTPAIYASPSALGYHTIATIGINVAPGEIDTVAEHMASLPNVHYVFISLGRYAVIIWALFQGQDELYAFITGKLGTTAGITGTETMVNLDMMKLSFAFFGTSQPPAGNADGMNETTSVQLTVPPGNACLDEQDLAIIRELQCDPRKPVVAVAKSLGIHRNVVTAKLKRLSDQDVVKAVIAPDPARLGYSVMAAMGIAVLPSAIGPASSTLKSSANIHSVGVCTGRYDIMLWGFFHDQEELYAFIRRELNSTPGMRNYEIMIIPRVKKMSFAYLPPARG